MFGFLAWTASLRRRMASGDQATRLPRGILAKQTPARTLPMPSLILSIALVCSASISASFVSIRLHSACRPSRHARERPVLTFFSILISSELSGARLCETCFVTKSINDRHPRNFQGQLGELVFYLFVQRCACKYVLQTIFRLYNISLIYLIRFKKIPSRNEFFNLADLPLFRPRVSFKVGSDAVDLAAGALRASVSLSWSCSLRECRGAIPRSWS